MSSVIFSVQTVKEYCYNYDSALTESNGQTLNQRILSVHKIKKGTSIFLLDKDETTKRIESAIPDIKIINIEKQFPNIVSINYVKLFDYVQIYSKSDTNYYLVNNGLKVTASNTESLPEENIINIRINGDIGEPSDGDKISTDIPYETTAIYNIMEALEKNMYYTDAISLFKFIDIPNEYTVYLQTRWGVCFKFLTANNAVNKLNMALSLLQEKDEYRYGGMIVVDNNNDASYSAQSSYNG